MQNCFETVFLLLTINLLLLNQFETSEIVLFTASFCKEHSCLRRYRYQATIIVQVVIVVAGEQILN